MFDEPEDEKPKKQEVEPLFNENDRDFIESVKKALKLIALAVVIVMAVSLAFLILNFKHVVEQAQ